MYNSSLPQQEDVVIPVIEETLSIDKQTVETGKIKIEKRIEEINEAAEINLLHDEYTITRIAVNKYVDEEVPQVRHEGDTMIIPVVKEVMVKRLLLVEEVRITKEVVPTTERLNIPLRKEIVTVTRTQNIGDASVQS